MDYIPFLTTIARLELRTLQGYPREAANLKIRTSHIRGVIASGAPREAVLQAVIETQSWACGEVWNLCFLTYLDQQLCTLRDLLETPEEREERRALARRIIDSMEAAR